MNSSLSHATDIYTISAVSTAAIRARESDGVVKGERAGGRKGDCQWQMENLVEGRYKGSIG